METVLKIFMIMVTLRLERVLLSKGLLAKEQAGFRSKEECVGQAIALMEVLERRREASKTSLLLFVDLSKAYDTVPHGALMYKLQQIGIRRRMYDFIKTLYDVSEVKVRLPSGAESSFKLERGLRQGCPASPILFDIFINDMFVDVHGCSKLDYGVEVPGVDVQQYGKLPGLLFADDLVGIADNIPGIKKMADRVSLWCKRWGMKVGIKKCGVMVVGPVGDERVDIIQGWLTDAPIRISGQDVPVVAEYQYLGLRIMRDMDVKAMVQDRCDKADKAYRKVFPYLRDSVIPVAARMAVFKAVVVSTALYGSEYWGMDPALCTGIQKLFNKALRIIAGTTEKNMSVSVDAMWREYNLAPVHAMASASRARAISKYPSLDTWIGILCNNPVDGRLVDKRRKPSTWVARSIWWMKKNGFEGVLHGKEYEMDERNGAHHGEYGARAKSAVQYELWSKEENKSRYGAVGPYLLANYMNTSWAGVGKIPNCMLKQGIGLYRGMRMLSMCRVGGMWTGAKIAKAFRDRVNVSFRTTCPSCKKNVEGGETVNHLMIECSRWDDARRRHIGQLLNVVGGMEESVEGRVVLLLGGELRGHKVESWLPVEETGECKAFQVAAFLQEIAGTHLAILQSMDDTLIDSLYLPLESQGPNG